MAFTFWRTLRGDLHYSVALPRLFQRCSKRLRSGDLRPMHMANIFGYSTPEQSHISLNDLIPIAMCIVSIRIEDVQCCTTDQHYADPKKDFLIDKSIDLFYIGGMIASTTSYPDEYLTRIFAESQLIIEKNTASFLLCPRLIFSAPQ